MPDVVGVVALSLTCFHGCVKGLVVLSKAKYYNRDVLDVKLRTELTLQALTTWADEAGLTQEPPTLFMSADNATLVPGILGQLETLLSDLVRIRIKYGLELQPTDEDMEVFGDTDAMQRPKSTKLADAAIFRMRKEPWKRLKWITLDDKKFDRLLEKAKTYIGELERFLEQAKQERRDRLLELCFRDAILNAHGPRELAIIGKEYGQSSSSTAVAAAAKLKQTRLSLGLLDPQFEGAALQSSHCAPSTVIASKASTPPPKDMKLSMRCLTLSRKARSQPRRTLALYENKIVLLEWKNVPIMTDPTIAKRVNQVAAFLQDLGLAFNGLQCRGFVKDRVDSRYGYIFDLPEEFNRTAIAGVSTTLDTAVLDSLPEVRPLRQMFDISGTPSLNKRLSLAATLLDTLLNLHTSGWLHKELQSDNIIFIRKATCDMSDDSCSGDISTYSVFISGYVYSRLDNPDEQTESMKTQTEADLYRHPFLLSEVRKSYSKSLDIFSVGCTLLEIGLWSSLRQILESHATTVSRISLVSLPNKARGQLAYSCPRFSAKAHGLNSEQHGGSNLDLMKLKHDLLLSPLKKATGRPYQQNTMLQSSTLSAADRSVIMQSLEAAMGTRYTRIVEDCLSAGQFVRESNASENEFSLELESRARDTVRDILKAI